MLPIELVDGHQLYFPVLQIIFYNKVEDIRQAPGRAKSYAQQISANLFQSHASCGCVRGGESIHQEI